MLTNFNYFDFVVRKNVGHTRGLVNMSKDACLSLKHYK